MSCCLWFYVLLGSSYLWWWILIVKRFTCYLLLDVWLRSFTSFECPTSCRHRDASWRSKLYQHRQRATVVNSSVTRLCCWRSASECPVAICTSWACIYVLSYHNNCHPSAEGRCGQYFLCLLIACTLLRRLLLKWLITAWTALCSPSVLMCS